MTKQKFAVLVEVTSIQEYIFSSNKLRENIGASYIIEKQLYSENGLMDEILNKMFGLDFNINIWKELKDLNTNSPCEVGYIGGGNALIFFEEEPNAKNFITRFSLECLLRFPSLKIAFGVKKDFNTSNYKNDYHSLLHDLKARKAKYIPNISISKHGITADCPWSNEAAEIFNKKSSNYISLTSASKLYASVQSFNNLYYTYKCLNGKYNFPDEIDELGQDRQASYIAVVHIDGNGMGKMFSNLNEIKELRKKSKAVSDKANSAMLKLIEHIIEIKEDNKLSALTFEKDDRFLPIRPILIGGDDVTFICEGRMGMYLAEKFIGYFYDETERLKDPESPEKLMDGACAGVAIVKSHFPFYKAVKLAEDLCGEAKKSSRINPGSYISFYYSATTFSGTLEELRGKTHVAQSGELHFGPYKLFKPEDSQSIEKLKEGIRLFKGKTSCVNMHNQPTDIYWPRNKVMRIREVITDTLSAQKLFEKEMKDLGLSFPNHKPTIWEKLESNTKSKTEMFDQIELMDFYLDNLL